MTGTAGSWRCAASPGSISTAGWSGKAGRLPTGVTRMRTLPRNRGHGRQGAGCGVGRSYRRGIGAEVSVSVAPSRRVSKRPGGARSRATSARTTLASTTFRAGGTTTDPNQYLEGGTVVLHRGQSTGGGMAALKSVTRVTAKRFTGRDAFGGARRSRLEESAALGRYQTVPGTREQPYPRWAIRTVNLGHVVCRRRGRAM